MSGTVIDKKTYEDLKELVGEAYMVELVETFLAEGPALLKAMSRALDEGDAETFRRSAHSLKSNSASFGVTQLADQARNLEYLGRDNQLNEARGCMDELEQTYSQAVAAIKAMP